MELHQITPDILVNMSLQELKSLETDLVKEISIQDTKQMAAKLSLNSCYGAVGCPYFRYYETDIAEAVTVTGQVIIQWLENGINAFLCREMDIPIQEFSTAGDTDSVGGETVIRVNGQEIAIAEFFDVCVGNFVRNDAFNQQWVKSISLGQYNTLATIDGQLVERPISYVMKHRVKKEMFKIVCDGKSVTITEDHSIMVKRDGRFISVRPKEMLPSDELIRLSIVTDTDRQGDNNAWSELPILSEEIPESKFE